MEVVKLSKTSLGQAEQLFTLPCQVFFHSTVQLLYLASVEVSLIILEKFETHTYTAVLLPQLKIITVYMILYRQRFSFNPDHMLAHFYFIVKYFIEHKKMTFIN